MAVNLVLDSSLIHPTGLVRTKVLKRMKISLQQRFERLYIPEPNTGCWIWLAYLTKKRYGSFNLGGIIVGAHRASYLIFCGEIPPLLTIDHLCRNKWCVNPDHLEVVSLAENTRRAFARSDFDTHCPNGHHYLKYRVLSQAGKWRCKQCERISARKRAKAKVARGLAWRKTKRGWRWISASQNPSRKGNNQFKTHHESPL